MDKGKKGQIILNNTDLRSAMEIFDSFPSRYNNYYHKNLDGRWKCEILEKTEDTLQLRLVDHIYEPPRGKNVHSESPIFHITLIQERENVSVNYKYKWNKTTFTLAFSYCLLVLLIFASGLYMISCDYSNIAYLIPLCNSVVLLSIGLVWLIRGKEHDELTICVFHELIDKNF
jgi:hypothetical protein